MIPVILASSSSSRQSMLRAAGVTFDIIAPDVDEDAVKKTMPGAAPRALAEKLAVKKALAGGSMRPDALVIGSDQVLECGGQLFSKVTTRAAARAVLSELRGREHRLIASVALARDQNILWQHTETATLAMRDFSDAFLDAYLEKEGDAILSSVGCYRIESHGAQLFARVEGDQFTVRGMPLFATLEALRRFGGLTP